MDGFIQLMEMMNAAQADGDSPDQRNQRIMMTMLKLMETKKMMEGCDLGQTASDERSLQMLAAINPYMTGGRRHMTEILIRVFEIRQIMNRMRAEAYGH